MKKATTSLLAMAVKKPDAGSATPQGLGTMGFRPNIREKDPAQLPDQTEDVGDRAEELAEAAAPSGDDRQRIVVRLNLEAVEAIEEIRQDLRRVSKRSVSFQKLMEEAVADLLRKYDKAAVVLPATTKRGR